MPEPIRSNRAAAARGQQRGQSPPPVRSLQQHEEGQEGDQDDPDQAGRDSPDDGEPGGRRSAPPGQVEVAGGRLDALDDLVPPFQHTGRTGALAKLGDELRRGVDQRGELRDEGRDEDQHQQGQHSQGNDVDREDGPGAFEAPPLKEPHRRVEREGQEQRDGDQGQSPGREEQEAHHRGDRHQDEQDHHHRTRADHHDPLGNRFAEHSIILRDGLVRHRGFGLVGALRLSLRVAQAAGLVASPRTVAADHTGDVQPVCL